MSLIDLSFNLKQKIKLWDGLIKQGLFHIVKKDLYALQDARVPREFVCELCGIARRVQLNLLILRWLKPYVRKFDSLELDSTNAERTLYASALMRIGAQHEAHDILQQMTDDKDPQILLAKSHLEIFQWNYDKAIPLLKKYIYLLEQDSYAILVGKLNLAAAYVAEHDWVNAIPLVDFLLTVCREKKHWLIYSNALELSAQIYIYKYDFTKAEARLREATVHLQGSGQNYEFFVKKWLAIIEILTKPTTAKSRKQMLAIQLQGAQLKDWETIREMDLFFAKATQNQELFLKVYFGTKSKSYRVRMKKVFQSQFPIPERYLWRSDFLTSTNAPQLDIKTGDTNAAGISLRHQPILLKTLQALVKDSYAPFSVGQLMSLIYPGEYFDSSSSPQRIYQAVFRLRSWLDKNQIPIQIKTESGHFSLKAIGPLTLNLYRKQCNKPYIDSTLSEFLSQWAKKAFAVKDIQETQHLSERASQRLLRKSVNNGTLECMKLGKKNIYKAI